jgi:hypothetical protein
VHSRPADSQRPQVGVPWSPALEGQHVGRLKRHSRNTFQMSNTARLTTRGLMSIPEREDIAPGLKILPSGPGLSCHLAAPPPLS